MANIQRWDVDMHGSMFESDDGPLVFHVDHVAAVAAAEQRVRDEVPYSETDAAYESGVKAARAAVTAVQAERGYDAAINWSEIGNEYAEGWTDLLSLILPAIDAIIDEGRNTG